MKSTIKTIYSRGSENVVDKRIAQPYSAISKEISGDDEAGNLIHKLLLLVLYGHTGQPA